MAHEHGNKGSAVYKKYTLEQTEKMFSGNNKAKPKTPQLDRGDNTFQKPTGTSRLS